ncbi:hypothetical protein DFP73DRAFT_552590 [Morchella snyderi]|nr:hypothetical protein DFP73DRAFT_552590 [Morchella snyderi]
MPPLSGNITSHSTPSPEDMSSAEYIARKYVPRRPTPQSVKARAAAAPILAERQFVAPPQIYRPPTPPRMVVDLEQDGTDVEMLDPPAPAPAPAPGSESGSGSERLIVKLRVQKPAASAPVPAPVPNPASATIDLTGTTPEPPAAHNHSHNQYHHGMPAFGELCEADLEWGKSTHEASPDKRPVLIPIPIPLQPPAPAQAQAQGPAWVEPLIEPLKREKALVKHTYNPSTIARDILIVMGRHPEFRALNAHLDSLRTIAGNEVDLTTVRWDLLDPGPELVSFGDDMAMEVGDMADDEGEGGVAVVARAVPAASAAAKSLVKGKGVVAPPVAAGKERKKKRASGSVLGASVASFGAHGGFTTAAGGSGGGGGGGAGSGSGNNNNTTAAPASASAETPRTQTRAGNNNGGSTARTASTLRTVMTPDAAAASSSSRNFSVIIQSPRAPTSGPSRPTPTTTTTTTNTLKRKSTSHSPAPKKPARLRRTKARDDPPPSGFKVFKCRWEHCPAELHNFETLHAHVAHNHGKPDNGVYSCRWAGCSRPAPTAAKRRGTGAAGGTYLLEFDAKEPWQRHMDEAHLDAVRRELGVGPAVGLYGESASYPPPASSSSC